MRPYTKDFKITVTLAVLNQIFITQYTQCTNKVILIDHSQYESGITTDKIKCPIHMKTTKSNLHAIVPTEFEGWR